MAAAFTFPPFLELIADMEARQIRRFVDIERQFLAVMGDFDARQAAGQLSSGENQNKGKFFNELVARLLERCAGFGVAQRGKRRGVLFPTVDVDLCYPAESLRPPLMIAETKMLGTPEHPGNRAGGPLGRAVSSDLDKRIREIALNVIDLKLADADGSPSPIGDISTWIQSTRPAFFALFGGRITGEGDLRRSLGKVQYLANSYGNGVGLALYEPVDPSTPAGRVTYRSIVSPGGMSIDDTITRMCRLIRSAHGQS